MHRRSATALSLPAKPLDDAIAARLLTAVTPLTIKLALEALTNLEARDKAISAQWHRKIERARYDADLAERRYEEADPSNRLVAGTQLDCGVKARNKSASLSGRGWRAWRKRPRRDRMSWCCC